MIDTLIVALITGAFYGLINMLIQSRKQKKEQEKNIAPTPKQQAIPGSTQNGQTIPGIKTTFRNFGTTNDAARCPNCGGELPQVGGFCPNCGQRVVAGQGAQPGTPLTGDIPLHFQSISLVNGHVGMKVTYLHKEHLIREEKWGLIDDKDVGGTEDYPIPPQVTTRQALKRYIEKHLIGLRITNWDALR